MADVFNFPAVGKCDSECSHTWTAVAGTFYIMGMSDENILRIRGMLSKSYSHGGRKAFSTLLGGWSKATRSILANEFYDTTSIGYCKSAQNSRRLLRDQGVPYEHIFSIEKRFRENGLGGIPPFLCFKEFYLAIVDDPTFRDVERVTSFGNLKRSGPPGDKSVTEKGLESFVRMISKEWKNQFDFTVLVEQYLFRHYSFARNSRVDISTKATFECIRELGGKAGYLVRNVIDFYDQDIDEFISVPPESDLYDITGTIFLKKEDWIPGTPMSMVVFPDNRKHPTSLHDVFGHASLTWAINEIINSSTIVTDVISDFGPVATGIPQVIVTGGYINSRVVPLQEEGYKCRVITIVEFAVSLIQGAARHIIDPILWEDPMMRIGILSPVKLYNVLRHIQRANSNQVFHDYAISADLTAATDSPYLQAVRTVLGPVAQFCPREVYPLTSLAVGLVGIPRRFTHKGKVLVDHVLHLCGIMMGEGLSGVFLNLMSSLVRSLIKPMINEFGDVYTGTTVDEADAFIDVSFDWIQGFLDVVGLYDHVSSSQSGDDLIYFEFDGSKDQVRGFFILAYRVFGMKPSESTFYASKTFATFTEEVCVRTKDSNGWRYVDAIKPRLLKSSATSTRSVISKINQSKNRLKYASEDFKIRSCFVADKIIENNKILRDRLKRYTSICPGFNKNMGGIGHPNGTLPEFHVEIDDRFQRLICYLAEAPSGDIFDLKFSHLMDGSSLNNEIFDTLRDIYNLVDGLSRGTPDQILNDENQFCYFGPLDVCPKNGMPYSLWLRLLGENASRFGLVTLSDISKKLIASEKLLDTLCESKREEDIPEIRQLRNRSQFLLSKVPADYVMTGTHSGMMKIINSRLNKVDHKYVKWDLIEETFDLVDLSSLKLGFT